MSKSKLPSPNVEFNNGGKWTEEMVRGMFCNPLYAGMGEYPGIVDDETWVAVAAKSIREEGAEQWLVNMLHTMRTFLPMNPDEIPHPGRQ